MDQAMLDENLNSSLLENHTIYNTLLDNEYDEYTPYNKRPESYIVPTLFACIYIVGILGNGIIVMIFLRHRSMRNIPNIYIFSLAVADLLIILVCVPVSGGSYTFREWIWGETLCRITEFSEDVFHGVAMYTLTALAVERYFAIVCPLTTSLLMTKQTIITAIFIWILAIICAAPSAIVSNLTYLQVESRTDNWTIATCQPYGHPSEPSTFIYAQYSVICKAIFYYILPLSIIGVLYVLMAREIHVSAGDAKGDTVGPQSKGGRHMSRMLVTFLIVFVVSFLPQHIFNVWFFCNPISRDEYNLTWHIFRMVGFSLSFLNSCINPIALYCVSAVFRQHFRRYLCCKPNVGDLLLQEME